MEKPKTKEGLQVGQYTPSEEFRAIAAHVCVYRPVDEGGGAPVAICGPAGDPESEKEAQLFSAAPELFDAAEDMLDTLEAIGRVLTDEIPWHVAQVRIRNILNNTRTAEARRAIEKALGGYNANED